MAFFSFPFPFTIRPLIFSSTGKLTLPLPVNCWQSHFTPGKTSAKRKEEKKQRARTFLSSCISPEWHIFLSNSSQRHTLPSWTKSSNFTLVITRNATSSLLNYRTEHAAELPNLAAAHRSRWNQQSSCSWTPLLANSQPLHLNVLSFKSNPKLLAVTWRLNTGQVPLPPNNRSFPFPGCSW